MKNKAAYLIAQEALTDRNLFTIIMTENTNNFASYIRSKGLSMLSPSDVKLVKNHFIPDL